MSDPACRALRAVVERLIHAEANPSREPEAVAERMRALTAYRDIFTPGLVLGLLARIDRGTP